VLDVVHADALGGGQLDQPPKIRGNVLHRAAMVAHVRFTRKEETDR
jgi:hypothetical protein